MLKIFEAVLLSGSNVGCEIKVKGFANIGLVGNMENFIISMAARYAGDTLTYNIKVLEIVQSASKFKIYKQIIGNKISVFINAPQVGSGMYVETQIFYGSAYANKTISTVDEIPAGAVEITR